MTALALTHSSPLYFTKPTPQWKSKAPILPPITIFRNRNINPSTKCRLNANARGFTSRKPPQRIIKDNTLDTKTSSNQENSSNEDDQLPREVFNRVIKRILVSVGVPMALGLAFLKLFGTVREQGGDVPVWLIFATSFVTFGTSALGIAYGALSTSLDPNKKGSLLGFEEVQHNWVEMWKEEDGNNI